MGENRVNEYPTAVLRKLKSIFNFLGVGGYLLVSIGKKIMTEYKNESTI